MEEGGGIHTRPSIIMTGSRKYNPFTVTWLPAVLASRRGKTEKMIGRVGAYVCVRIYICICVYMHHMYMYIYIYIYTNTHVSGKSVWTESV